MTVVSPTLVTQGHARASVSAMWPCYERSELARSDTTQHAQDELDSSRVLRVLAVSNTHAIVAARDEEANAMRTELREPHLATSAVVYVRRWMCHSLCVDLSRYRGGSGRTRCHWFVR